MPATDTVLLHDLTTTALALADAARGETLRHFRKADLVARDGLAARVVDLLRQIPRSKWRTARGGPSTLAFRHQARLRDEPVEEARIPARVEQVHVVLARVVAGAVHVGLTTCERLARCVLQALGQN